MQKRLDLVKRKRPVYKPRKKRKKLAVAKTKHTFMKIVVLPLRDIVIFTQIFLAAIKYAHSFDLHCGHKVEWD